MLPECPCSVARPPALRMSDEQLAYEIASIRDELRPVDVHLAAKLSRLIDRLQGFDALPRKKADAIVSMATRTGSKRIQVQSVRAAFGL